MNKLKIVFFFVFLGLLIVIASMFYTAHSERVFLQASYLQLACENCTHMEVVKSRDASLLSTTIIPQSDVYDIESIIPVSSIGDADLCLEGVLYTSNLANLFGIDPSGLRFEVLKVHPLESCSTLPAISDHVD